MKDNLPFTAKDGTVYDIVTEAFLYKGTETSYWNAKVYLDGAFLFKSANYEGENADAAAHTEGLKWAQKQK